MNEQEATLVRELLELARYLDGRVDSEFRLSTDPPCEDERRLDEIRGAAIRQAGGDGIDA